jgi:hypothetical protein
MVCIQVYFAPQELCGSEEGTIPSTGRADECVNGVLFASTDLGKSFEFRGLIGGVAGLAPNVSSRVNSCSEPDVLPLGNGTILAACRFQNDPCSLVYYSNAGITVSHDRGVTWTVTGLLTGWAQQDGSLLKLDDGTIVMPFAHKDKGYGQRALFSYDNGVSPSLPLSLSLSLSLPFLFLFLFLFLSLSPRHPAQEHSQQHSA